VDEFTWALAFGRIIGKRGATVNRIQDETGANVQIDQRLGECVVFGSAQQVSIAADMIRLIMLEGDGPPGPWSQNNKNDAEGGATERIPCTGSEAGPGHSSTFRLVHSSTFQLTLSHLCH
jgi:far upstream element-binding protein